MSNTADLSIPRPSLVQSNPTTCPVAIFSDFDGTIFLQDTGHVLFDTYGCGKEMREKLDGSIGVSKSFREASEEMWGSLNVKLEDALKALSSSLQIDQGFESFFSFCEEHKIPFNVISAGLNPLLRGALDHALGTKRSQNIDIVSNDGEISESGDLWKPVWRHDCELGHDKALSIKEFRDSVEGEQPLLVFIGDGVSDLAAASQADILFARKGLKLEKYCIEHKIPYIPYDSFADIEVELEELIRGNPHHDNNNFTRPKRLSLSNSDSSLSDSSIPVHTIPSSPTPMTPAVEPPTFSKNTDYLSSRPVNMRTFSSRSVGAVNEQEEEPEPVEVEAGINIVN